MFGDAPATMGQPLDQGNDVDDTLDPDTRADANRHVAALAAGGTIEQQIGEMFRGDHFGAVADRVGVQGVVNRTGKR